MWPIYNSKRKGANNKRQLLYLLQCMKQGHKVGECGLKKTCVYRHQWNNRHRSICLQKFVATNREGVHLVEELPADEDSNIKENALLSSGEMVLMQTATADISNPISGQIQNVRMLFETGSQGTYTIYQK